MPGRSQQPLLNLSVGGNPTSEGWRRRCVGECGASISRTVHGPWRVRGRPPSRATSSCECSFAHASYSQNLYEKDQRIYGQYFNSAENYLRHLNNFDTFIRLIQIILKDRNVLLHLTIRTTSTEFNNSIRKNALREKSNETFAGSRKFCYSPFSIPQWEKKISFPQNLSDWKINYYL